MVLGANVFNMAVVEVYVGYAIYRLLVLYGEFRAAFAAGCWDHDRCTDRRVQVGQSHFGVTYQLLTTLSSNGRRASRARADRGAITASVLPLPARARRDSGSNAASEVSA